MGESRDWKGFWIVGVSYRLLCTSKLFPYIPFSFIFRHLPPAQVVEPMWWSVLSGSD